MATRVSIAHDHDQTSLFGSFAQARIVALEEIASVVPGYSPRSGERVDSGKYVLLGGRNIKDGRVVRTSKDSYIEYVAKNSFQRQSHKSVM